MKKVFMSFAVVALMVAAVACGNNKAKKAEDAALETVEAAADSCCKSDSCAAACADSVACEAEAVAE